MSFLFAKQIGLKNYIFRGIKIKILKKFSETINYNTVTNNFYKIAKWDPSGSEVYMTQCFADWGNEYLFLDSISQRQNEVFLDIGCHTAYFPILFKDYFTKIIGFEPSLKCINHYKKLNLSNFLYYQNFIGDENTEVLGSDSNTGYSFYKDSKQYDQKDINKKIKKITLDDFVSKSGLNKISAIKIDIDGFDLQVLYGAKKIIAENRPSIMIENYSKELFNFFNDLNYDLLAIVADKKQPYNLNLEIFKNFDESKWVKMVCCIPKEFKKNYKTNFFKGNIFSGINKNKILKTFNFKQNNL